MSLRHVTKECNVGRAIINNSVKQEDKLLMFCGDNNKWTKEKWVKHRTGQRHQDLDFVLVRLEDKVSSIPVAGLFTMKPARILHDKVDTESEYEHPESWRRKSKCHAVKYLKICGETAVMKQLRITWINLLRSCLMKTLILNKFAKAGETSSTFMLFLEKP